MKKDTRNRENIQADKDDPVMVAFHRCKSQLEQKFGLRLEKKEVLGFLCKLAEPKIKEIAEVGFEPTTTGL